MLGAIIGEAVSPGTRNSSGMGVLRRRTSGGLGRRGRTSRAYARSRYRAAFKGLKRLGLLKRNSRSRRRSFNAIGRRYVGCSGETFAQRGRSRFKNSGLLLVFQGLPALVFRRLPALLDRIRGRTRENDRRRFKGNGSWFFSYGLRRKLIHLLRFGRDWGWRGNWRFSLARGLLRLNFQFEGRLLRSVFFLFCSRNVRIIVVDVGSFLYFGHRKRKMEKIRL